MKDRQDPRRQNPKITKDGLWITDSPESTRNEICLEGGVVRRKGMHFPELKVPKDSCSWCYGQKYYVYVKDVPFGALVVSERCSMCDGTGVQHVES